VRSANTGISAFINPIGEIEQSAPWWKAATLKQSVYSDQRKTFFVQWGDWISKLALTLTTLIILVYFFRKMKSKKNTYYA
jgi:apolipoprotein N-acyltransferase